MDPFIIFLTIVITILTILLVIVGIQIILILRNVNITLTKTNRAINAVELLSYNLTHPIQDTKALGQGIKMGLEVASHITSWVKEKDNQDQQQNKKE